MKSEKEPVSMRGRILSLVGGVFFLSCSCLAQEAFKMSSLVVPQPVTYALHQIALTQGTDGEGGYRLVFSVTLHNHVAGETFRIEGPARVHVEGVSVPLVVTCTDQTLKLGVEDVVCHFSYPVKDQALLSELKQIDARKAWHRVSVVLRGSEFPIVSEKTGKNVLLEMSVAEQKIPTTEIVVGFGDVKRLSPWRVRQRYGRSSGRRGLVTVRDALAAINELVAQDDAMPENTFAFAPDGALASVCDEPYRTAAKAGAAAIDVRAVAADGAEAHVADGDLLSRPVRDFRKVEFFKGGTAGGVAGGAAGGGAPSSAGRTKTITLPGGAKMEMIWCPPGEFEMGSPLTEDGRFEDEVLHPVKLTRGFWLGKYEVTQGQWKSVMGDEGASLRSRFKGENRPVENVSWHDCQSFMRKMNETLGGAARLPTEAEWEYACRAGTAGAFAGDGSVDEMAWYDGNSGSQTHDVGAKKANAWGFYDMHGNVLEWCSDWFAKTATGSVDPKGPASGSFRVLRGGSWFYYARDCRSAYRQKRDPGIRNFVFGFRLAITGGPND